MTTPRRVRLPACSSDVPLPKWLSGDRSVRRLLHVDGQLLALCHSAFELHRLDLASGRLESSRVERDAELFALDTSRGEYDRDAAERGIVIVGGERVCALPESTEISFVLPLDGGALLLELEGQRLVLYDGVAFSDVPLPRWGSLPTTDGDHVVVPYGAAERRGWIAWNVRTGALRDVTRATGPFCTAALLRGRDLVLAWAEDPGDALAPVRETWLEVHEFKR